MITQAKSARMTIDLSKEKHKKLKAIAAISGISMQELVLQAIEQYLQTDNINAILHYFQIIFMLQSRI